jgi:hypothetical protein
MRFLYSTLMSLDLALVDFFNLFAFPAFGGLTVNLLRSSLMFWIAIFNWHRKGIGASP